MPNDSVTISRSEYEELLEAEEMLFALQAAGVDNWEGYSHALEILAEGDEVEDEE